MKKIVSIILAMMLLIGVVSINAFAAGGLGISTGSLSLKPGAKGTVTVSASNCAGTFSVSSSNPSVATASASTDWLDNDSATISISAKSAGTAVITVKATDMATYDEDDISGQTRRITVTVATPATTTTTAKAEKPTEKTSETTTFKTDDVTKETTTAVPVAAKAELGSLKVVANNDVAVSIVPGTYDYEIKVPYGTKSLTVDASALDDATVEVVGNDNISDGSIVNINVTSKDGVKTVYSVKVTYEEPEVKQVVERDGVSKGLVIIIGLALFFLGLIIGLLLGFLIGKKRFENVDYFGGNDGYDGGFVSGSADDDGDGVVSPFQTSGFNFESAGGMGLNYDFANDGFEDSADDDAVSLRDPIYSEPETPVFEMAADEPAPEVNVPPVAPVIPVAEPVAAPAPVVEPAAPVAEPAPAYVAPEPAYEAPTPAYAPVAPVEPVAPVAEPAPAYVAPEPAYAAPVVEPVAPVVEPAPAEPVSGLGLINSALNDAPAAPVAEPVAPIAEPVAPIAEPVAPIAEPVAPIAEPVAPIAEPVATPYIDDAPPVLPYEAGKAFGSIPFEQSAD